MEDPLPIKSHQPVIEMAVQSHRVVIIQAETGAGKSTQVPQYLIPLAKEVIVTQPRRIAAASVAKRVAAEMGVELGTLVGYRTATEQKVSAETKLTFCTDGLEMMRQLFEDEHHEDSIVVIDEAHEWNLNLEILVAWFKLKLSQGLNIRLVIMSATIEAELLAAYFDDAEIISTRGRTFPITEIKPRGGVASSVQMLLQQGCNVLVFLPGKNEIRKMDGVLRHMSVNAEVLPLHAELSPEEQEACFAEYKRPKCILATNIAQTSITVPDIDAVVDSGMERRPEIVDGVEGLYLRAISLADREQRKGRAGRVRSGIYIDCCPVPTGQRKMFPRAAILTCGLEGMVLQLLCGGVQPEDLHFFHKPPPKHIESARKTLIALRCLDKDGNVTETGRNVALLPMGVRYARMVVETLHKEGDRKAVDARILTLAVIIETGGVRSGKNERWKQYAPPLPIGGNSDAYIELSAFETVQNLPLERVEELGVDPEAFERARDELQRVLRALKSKRIKPGHVRDILPQQAICAGLADQLYKRSFSSDDYIRVIDPATPRRLPKDSAASEAEFLVGIPWNFQVNSDFGPQTKRILKAATVVHPLLVERVSG